MSEFWRWADYSPFLSFLLICSMYYSIKSIIRCVNILIRGWPPDHLDADGDYHKDNGDTQDE